MYAARTLNEGNQNNKKSNRIARLVGLAVPIM
jgi:hypothetical protein